MRILTSIICENIIYRIILSASLAVTSGREPDIGPNIQQPLQALFARFPGVARKTASWKTFSNGLSGEFATKWKLDTRTFSADGPIWRI